MKDQFPPDMNQQEANKAENDDQYRLVGSFRLDPPKGTIQQNQGQSQEQNARKNLFWSRLASIAQILLVIAAFGVAKIYWNQLDTMQDQLAAMQGQLTMMREDLALTQRASVAFFKINDTPPVIEPDKEYTVTIMAHNFGREPAYLDACITHTVVPIFPKNPIYPGTAVMPGADIIMPNDDMAKTFYSFHIGPAGIDKMTQVDLGTRGYLFIYGKFWYESRLLEETRRYCGTFCFVYDWSPVRSGRFTGCSTYNQTPSPELCGPLGLPKCGTD